jgi:hypothetical protein
MRSIFFLLILFLFQCSPKFSVQSDTPFPGDFQNYHSFKFFNPKNMPASNFSFEESDQKVIFEAVSDEMKARGYKSVQDADLMIKIQGGTKNTVNIQNDNRYYPYDYNYNYYNRYGRYYDYYNRPRNESKKESTLIIDIMDIKKDKIVWQGVGIGVLGKNEALSELQIREAITNIFKEYPHSAGNTN